MGSLTQCECVCVSLQVGVVGVCTQKECGSEICVDMHLCMCCVYLVCVCVCVCVCVQCVCVCVCV